jgi:hypothetical protein
MQVLIKIRRIGRASRRMMVWVQGTALVVKVVTVPVEGR